LVILRETNKRIIAICHGAARGGAIGLLAVCDDVIADPKATFACPERQHGIHPTIITPFVQEALGESADALLAGSITWDAKTALEKNLIQHIHRLDSAADVIKVLSHT
jgi:methylglutaconyl-CoA hydratase